MDKYDMIGRRFGRLEVVGFAGANKKKLLLWECLCECGRRKNIAGTSLRSGRTKSCGCLQREHAGSFNRRHGRYKTKLYSVWQSMKDRCSNKNNKRYSDYGGRGVTVCHEWDDFVAFYTWAVSAGYCEGLSIDRIDNDRGYSPENCRWATAKEQGINRRTTKKVEYNGETKALTEWCAIYGKAYGTVKTRLKRGWSIHQALTLDSRRGRKP